jgi:membrane associated rhomboid family serine protease
MKKLFLTFLSLMLGFIAIFIGIPNATTILGFSGESFFRGDIWRILTFSLTHVSLVHLIENLISLFIVTLLAYEFDLEFKEFIALFAVTSILIAFTTGMIFPYILIVGASLGLYGLFGAISIKGKEYVPTTTFFMIFTSIILLNFFYNLFTKQGLAQPTYHALGFFVGASLVKVRQVTKKKKRILS